MTDLERLRDTIGWIAGREEFVEWVLACGGFVDGCDAEVARRVLAGSTIADARRGVVDQLTRRSPSN